LKDRGREKILIVDVDPINVCVLEEILSDRYDLQSAANGEDALAKAASFRPDLMLLDIMMPGLDGYEVCRRLKANATFRNLKVILVSAKAMLSERLTGYDCGADDYITKPFDDSELLAKVRVFLRLKSIEEVDRFKTEILELLSHEVRTPLTVILPSVEMLLANVPLNEGERNKLIRAILENVQVLHQLFDQVMLLFHFRTNRVHLEATDLDLAALVRSCAAAFPADREDGKGVTVEAKVPESLRLDGDWKYLKMVIESLLENAAQHSPPSGKVLVEVRQEGDRVRISVSDQGPGIDPAILPRLFDGFSVGEIMNHHEGLGLSLAIDQAIVQSYGGMIEACSVEGQGATIAVTLPVKRTTLPEGEGWTSPIVVSLGDGRR
jgi:two-component system sensor histidine kinase/response regulator